MDSTAAPSLEELNALRAKTQQQSDKDFLANPENQPRAQATSTNGSSAPPTLDELNALRAKAQAQETQQTQTNGSTAPPTIDELNALRAKAQAKNQPEPDDKSLAAEGEITESDAQHLRSIRALANQYGNPTAVIDGINAGKITQNWGHEVSQRLLNDFQEAAPQDQALMLKREQDYIDQTKPQQQQPEQKPSADALQVWGRNQGRALIGGIQGTEDVDLNRLRSHEQELLNQGAISPEEFAHRNSMIDQLVTRQQFHPGAPSSSPQISGLGGQPPVQDDYQRGYQALVDQIKKIDPDYAGAIQQAATERATAGAEVGLQSQGQGGSLATAGRVLPKSLYNYTPEQLNAAVAEAGKNAQIAALREGHGLSPEAEAAIKAETEKAGATYRTAQEQAKAGWAPSTQAPGSIEAGLSFLEQQAATAYLAPYLETGIGLGLGKLAIPFKFGGDQALSLGQLWDAGISKILGAEPPMKGLIPQAMRWGSRVDLLRRIWEAGNDPGQFARDISNPWTWTQTLGEFALARGIPLIARMPGVGLRLGGYTGRGLAMLMRAAAGTVDASMLGGAEGEVAGKMPLWKGTGEMPEWSGTQLAADERPTTGVPLEDYATPLRETAFFSPKGQYSRFFNEEGIQNLPMNVMGTRAANEAYSAGTGWPLIPQLIRRSIVPYTAGALTAVPFDIGKPIPEIMHDMNQQGLFNLLFSAPHILGGSIRGSQADKGFAYSQSHINDKDLPMPQIQDPNNPGQPHPLQQEVWNALGTLDKPRRNDAIAAIEMAKAAGMDYYPLPDALAHKILREKYGTTGSVEGGFFPHGTEIDPNWNTSERPQSYVPISSVDFSQMHEAVGHAAFHLLDPEDQEAIRQHLENDPNFDKDAFVRRYANGYSGGIGPQPRGYDDLPTNAEIAAGDRGALTKYRDWGNMTQENAMKEAAVEHFASVYSSDKLENWKKESPGWRKQWGQMLSDLMQKIGFPGTTADVDGPLSVNKSYVLGAAMRPYLRKMARGEFMANRPPAGSIEIPGATGRGPEPPPAPVPPPSRPEPTFEAIQRRAFEKYQAREAAGRPGDEKTDWAEAEQELRGQKFEKVPDAEKVPGFTPGTPPYYHRMLELINEGVDPGTAHEVAVGNMRKAAKAAPSFMPSTSPRGARGESRNKEDFAKWIRGLPQHEQDALHQWVGGGEPLDKIRALQKAEATGTPPDPAHLDTVPLQKAWESAIDKSPVHQGPAYRGLRNLTDEEIAAFRDPGNVVRTHADASASTNQNLAANLAGSGPNVRAIEPGKHGLVLEIHGSHGSINPHGERPWPIGSSDEREVIVPRGTNYELKDFRENYYGDNAHHAVLQQLPETSTQKPAASFMPATKAAVQPKASVGFRPSVTAPAAPSQQEQKQEDTYGGDIIKRLTQYRGELGQGSLEPPEAPAPAVKGWTKIPRGANTSLDTLQPDFAPKVQAWMKAMRDAGFNPQIVQAGREPNYQAELYARYQHGGPKAAPPEASYHTYGRAVDWVNVDRNGNQEWENHKAYDFGRKMAQQFGLTGISGDEDHLQDAGYATYKDLPKEEYGQVHGGGEYETNPEDMDKHLGGVLQGKGNAFVEAGRKYGVDPKLLAAIAMFETGNGQSKAAHAYNNIAGLMDRNSPDQRGFQIFKSVEDSIDSEAALIRDYMDHGLRTIDEIGARYAPVGHGGKPVANDRNDTNKDWPRFVAQFYEKLGGKAGGEDLGAPEQEWRRYVRGSSGTIELDNDVASRRDGAFNTAEIRKELGWGNEWTPEKTGAGHTYLEEQEQGGGGNIENAGGMPGETQAPAAPTGGGGSTYQFRQPSPVSQAEVPQQEAPEAPSALTRAYAPSGYDYEMPVSQESSEVPSYMMAQEMTGRPFGAAQAPGYAAFMPSASYMAGRRKKPGEEEEEPEEEPGDLGSILGKIGTAPTQKAQSNLLGQALQAHAASLPEGDKRVQKDPITGLFKGEHFVPGDPMHEYALANTPDEHKQVMQRAEQSMRNGQLMYLTHIAAPAQPGVLPTRGSRTAEYALSPAEQRAIGAERGIGSGHAIIPTAEGISFAKKKGQQNTGFVQGISTSVAASNAQHINDELGAKSPYPDITSKKFLVDLHGYLHNINNGWEGDGSKPVKGTKEIPINPTPGHIPFPMKRGEADFMNAIMNNTAAQEKGPNAARLREFAQKGGKLLSPEGEVNPIRAEINAAQAQRRMAALQKAPHDPVLRDIASKLWSQDILEPTIRHFRGDLTRVHDRPEEMEPEIRPPEGSAEIQHAMMRQGLPRKEMVGAGYMPATGKKKAKSPEQLAAEKEDLRQAAIDRDDITPEEKYELQHVQKLAQQWVKDNPDLPETAAHHYLEGRADFPDWVRTKEHVGKHFGEVNPKLDYSKPEHQEIAANTLMHDIMRGLAKKSTAYGWYDRNVDKSIRKIAQVAPQILTDPEHAMAFKLATAITSQGQDVFPNFESGYLAYRHWAKTGKMPESADVFGGGPKAKAMIANFKKINDLREAHGFEGLKNILETKMRLGDLRDNYGIKLGGESPNHEMEGAALLGPKIGSFYNNLNKRFHTITFDLWASRTMNRLAGNMLKFSPDKMLKDKVTKAGATKPSHISQLEGLLDTGELEGASDEEREAMRNEIAALRGLGSNASRTKVLRTAPTIAKWAERTHANYAKGVGTESERSYPPELKSPSTSLAKNMDLNLTDLSDAPRGPKQRQQWRDIFKLVQDKMRDAGIDMNHANNQAVLWFMEQQLFRKAGSRNRASYDYLDAAHRLVRKVKGGELPQMEEQQPLHMQEGGPVPVPGIPDQDPRPWWPSPEDLKPLPGQEHDPLMPSKEEILAQPMPTPPPKTWQQQITEQIPRVQAAMQEGAGLSGLIKAVVEGGTLSTGGALAFLGQGPVWLHQNTGLLGPDLLEQMHGPAPRRTEGGAALHDPNPLMQSSRQIAAKKQQEAKDTDEKAFFERLNKDFGEDKD